ncbi:MAG TPA: hypothetical protein VG142_04730 [Trebonia sp.]|jgi:hypothetical protein|nr:hypothetical protein [Trebonia sp.]
MVDMHANGGASGDPRRRRSFSRRTQVATGILACAVVVAGGAFAVTEAVSGGHPASATPATVGTAATGGTGGTGETGVNGLAGQAAVLSDTLSSAALATSTPSATAGTAADNAAQRAERLRARRLLAQIRGLGGQYGQFTYGTKAGSRTLAYERGSVVSVAGGDVTVRAEDGTTWTWALVSRSVVRENGERVESGTPASGETVFVGGLVTGTTRDAKLVVIR